MKCFIALLLCILAVAFAAPSPANLALMGNRYTFDMWLAEFMPHQFLQIDASNYVAKRRTFEANVKTILEHNQSNSSYKMGINQWTAFTSEQVVSVLGFDRSSLSKNAPALKYAKKSEGVKLDSKALPTEVDWSTKLHIGVKNQGSCGSCWAFAASSTLAGHLEINDSLTPSLNISQQALVSCLVNKDQCGGTGGCQGATAELAFDYVAEHGTTFDSVYPYTSGSNGQNGKCLEYAPAVGISGYVQLTDNSKEQLMEAVATKGPVSISVDASRFSLYSSGVFNTCANKDNTVALNHAVVLVGYGEDDKHGKYFKIQNSWGPSWGEKGYIRIARAENEEECRQDVEPQDGYACKGETEPITVCGCAGMLARSSYPLGVHYKNL